MPLIGRSTLLPLSPAVTLARISACLSASPRLLACVLVHGPRDCLAPVVPTCQTRVRARCAARGRRAPRCPSLSLSPHGSRTTLGLARSLRTIRILASAFRGRIRRPAAAAVAATAAAVRRVTLAFAFPGDRPNADAPRATRRMSIRRPSRPDDTQSSNRDADATPEWQRTYPSRTHGPRRRGPSARRRGCARTRPIRPIPPQAHPHLICGAI